MALGGRKDVDRELIYGIMAARDWFKVQVKYVCRVVRGVRCGPRGFLAKEKHPNLSWTLRGYSSPVVLCDHWPILVTWYVLCRHFPEIEPFGLSIRGEVPQRISS